MEMEKITEKEFTYAGPAYNGFTMLFVQLIVLPLLAGSAFLLPTALWPFSIAWAVLLGLGLLVMPAGYIAPTLGRSPEESAAASGVCSILTAVCLAAFCVMAVILA